MSHPKAAIALPTMMNGRRRPMYFAYFSGSRSESDPTNGEVYPMIVPAGSGGGWQRAGRGSGVREGTAQVEGRGGRIVSGFSDSSL